MPLDRSRWEFTGKPCKHGHLTLRQVANRACGACVKGRLGKPKQPAYWWPLLRTWIDPASRDPWALDKAVKAIKARAELWKQYGLAASNARRLGARRGERLMIAGQLFAAELPPEFYGSDGLALSRSQFFTGPFGAA